MKAGSGLASGPQAAPELAREAVAAALSAAGIERADDVLLLLTPDLARQAQPAVIAAARAAGTLSVAGGTANGVFSERAAALDQPAAAALVIAGSTGGRVTSPVVCWSGHSRLPYDWQPLPPRAGLLDAGASAWAHGRVSSDGCAEWQLPAGDVKLARSSGLRRVGDPQPVDNIRGYDLLAIGGLSAADSLARILPPEWRERPPLHLIALLGPDDAPPLTVLARNSDGSLTLSGPPEAGEWLTWAIRQPLAAEDDMRQTLAAAVDNDFCPDFALMFSCIGRGPLFYGGEDRDLQVFRERFPDTPLIGAWGTGQIAPVSAGNRLFHHSVVSLLYRSLHV